MWIYSKVPSFRYCRFQPLPISRPPMCDAYSQSVSCCYVFTGGCAELLDRKQSLKTTQTNTQKTPDRAAAQQLFRGRYAQRKAQPPSQIPQRQPASHQNQNHPQKLETIACPMGSTNSSIMSLNPHTPHHPDGHPYNPATTSTFDNSPSPREPVAPATETVVQSTHPQSSRSSSQTSTPNPKTTARSYKIRASPWAVCSFQYQIPPGGQSSQKQNHPSAAKTETETEKATESPAQMTHSSPRCSPVKRSCPPSTSTRTQTPTPPQHTHPLPP